MSSAEMRLGSASACSNGVGQIPALRVLIRLGIALAKAALPSSSRRDKSRNLEQRLGHCLPQAPGDLHRPLPPMVDERRGPEELERRTGTIRERRVLAHKQQDVRAVLPLAPVAAARG